MQIIWSGVEILQWIVMRQTESFQNDLPPINTRKLLCMADMQVWVMQVIKTFVFHIIIREWSFRSHTNAKQLVKHLRNSNLC